METRRFVVLSLWTVAIAGLVALGMNQTNQLRRTAFVEPCLPPPLARPDRNPLLDSGVSTEMSDLSLFVREQTDFLITPALLVQEAITEGVVLTYPEE